MFSAVLLAAFLAPHYRRGSRRIVNGLLYYVAWHHLSLTRPTVLAFDGTLRSCPALALRGNVPVACCDLPIPGRQCPIRARIFPAIEVCWWRAYRPLIMGCSALLSVVSQLLSVCNPSGFHGWERPSIWQVLSNPPGYHHFPNRGRASQGGG